MTDATTGLTHFVSRPGTSLFIGSSARRPAQ
jgi:hypothetical protein